ncbi:hypothetical protein D3C72_2182000 [compost metagenome]
MSSGSAAKAVCRLRSWLILPARLETFMVVAANWSASLPFMVLNWARLRSSCCMQVRASW